MSYIKEVQRGGNWVQGGTYSFKVWNYGTDNGYGSCSINEIPGNLFDPSGGLWGDNDTTVPRHTGNILFLTDEDTLTGGVPLAVAPTWEELSDGWWKVTIIIDADFPEGNYYLKYGTFWECQVVE